MSRLNAPGPMSSRPVNNVYTGLAFVSTVATIVALIYVAARFVALGVFSH